MYGLCSPEMRLRLFRESEAYLWSMQGTTLELTHNYGSEDDPNFSVWNGNEVND